MRTVVSIMSSWCFNQQYWTILCERPASIRTIEWILYSPGIRGTAKSVRFTEQRGVRISESCEVLRVMQIQSRPQHFVLCNEVSAIENVR